MDEYPEYVSMRLNKADKEEAEQLATQSAAIARRSYSMEAYGRGVQERCGIAA